MTLERMAPVRSTMTWIASAVISVLLLAVSHTVALTAAFPFGGGEFHAMFAYSDVGHPEVAWSVFVVSVGALAGVATALVGLLRPSRPWFIIVCAAAIGLAHWWAVVSWEPQSEEFHRLAVVLAILMPLVVSAPPLGLWLTLRRWHDAMSPRLLKAMRVSAILLICSPYVLFASGYVPGWTAELRRIEWRGANWELPNASEVQFVFDPAQGVVFPEGIARSLLDQCTRPTPGLVTGTWTPSAGDIAQLENDLGRYLVQQDTGRTRASGFVMPSFATYYRQYGGITLWRDLRVIYVNALLPDYWTEPTAEGEFPWRSEAVSVCGGWQAYFGVEYDPATRMFRGFSYNPSL